MTKHDSKTADELIVENAPDSATHYCCGTYCKANKDFFYDWDGEYWCAYFVPDGYMRSLADITELVELRKKNAELRFANNEAKEYIESELGSVFITVCPGKPFNPKEHQAIRDLEQQVKGIEEVIKEMRVPPESLSFGLNDIEELRQYFLNKAKQLKEQSNE